MQTVSTTTPTTSTTTSGSASSGSASAGSPAPSTAPTPVVANDAPTEPTPVVAAGANGASDTSAPAGDATAAPDLDEASIADNDIDDNDDDAVARLPWKRIAVAVLVGVVVFLIAKPMVVERFGAPSAGAPVTTGTGADQAPAALMQNPQMQRLLNADLGMVLTQANLAYGLSGTYATAAVPPGVTVVEADHTHIVLARVSPEGYCQVGVASERLSQPVYVDPTGATCTAVR